MKTMYNIEPVLEERMWGDRSLIERFNLETKLDNVAECYCVIAIPNHLDCKVSETGECLSDFYHNHPEVFNCESEYMPVRMVLGSSKNALSVQIHPDDEYALAHGNIRGKHEGELIVEGAKEGGKMILGHHAKTREEFIKLSEEKQWDKLFKYITLNTGDYVHVPYNTLHGSLGGGLIVSFSTNGDVTYRLYDYDRIDPKTGKQRQLHKQDVYNNVICPNEDVGKINYKKIQHNNCVESIFFDEAGLYTGGRYVVNGFCEIERKEFYYILCLDGEGKIDGRTISKGKTFLIPADSGKIKIEGKLDLVYLSYRNRK